MHKSTLLFIAYYKKIIKYLPYVLSTIILFEVFMLVYALLEFDLLKAKSLIYLSSYIMLLLTSAFSLIVVLKTKRNIDNNARLIRGTSSIYITIMLIWSIIISSLDASFGSYPIVFITIIFTIPFILISNPIYLSAISIIGGIIISLSYTYLSNQIETSFYINMFIALLFNIFIIYKSYSTFKNEYEATNKLKALALTDSLTGLYNRRALDDRLSAELSHVGANLIMLDIDDFKTINDTKGHKEGDDCLFFIANLLSSIFGNTNVFRFGGDEFLVICSQSKEEILKNLQVLSQNIKKSGAKYNHLKFCAGFYEIKNTNNDPIKCADIALYNAKKSTTKKIIDYDSIVRCKK